MFCPAFAPHGHYHISKHCTQPMDFDFKEPTLAIHELIHGSRMNEPGARDRLESTLVEKSMYDLYMHLTERGVLKTNTNMGEQLLRKKNERLASLEQLVEKEPDNESYVFSINKQISEFYAQTVDVKKSFETMKVLMRDDVSLSLKMDIFLCRIRMAIILKNKKLLEESVEQADDTCMRGCDWDRRNKYKVYKGVFSLMRARFSDAAVLFSEALPSFESSEVVSYQKAVTYLVFSGLLTFDRKDISTRILESSEVVGSSETLGLKLAKSLFDCVYGDFMYDLYCFSLSVKEDVFVGGFVDFFCKEMKLRAYRQVLESYQSMSLSAMAETFGVEEEYIEKDLSRFIVEGRMGCKIDRVSKVVHMDSVVRDGVDSIINVGNNLVRKIKKYIK